MEGTTRRRLTCEGALSIRANLVGGTISAQAAAPVIAAGFSGTVRHAGGNTRSVLTGFRRVAVVPATSTICEIRLEINARPAATSLTLRSSPNRRRDHQAGGPSARVVPEEAEMVVDPEEKATGRRDRKGGGEADFKSCPIADAGHERGAGGIVERTPGTVAEQANWARAIEIAGRSLARIGTGDPDQAASFNRDLLADRQINARVRPWLGSRHRNRMESGRRGLTGAVNADLSRRTRVATRSTVARIAVEVAADVAGRRSCRTFTGPLNAEDVGRAGRLAIAAKPAVGLGVDAAALAATQPGVARPA